MAAVRNINGSADNRPPLGYTSWREYWEKNKGRRFGACSCVECVRDAEVGGHVKKVYGDNSWYIVPICYGHNNLSSDVVYNVNDTDLLPVN